MTARNPWVLSEQEARARDDAIFEQFRAVSEQAIQRFATMEEAGVFMCRQGFGNPAVMAAVVRSMKRRSAP